VIIASTNTTHADLISIAAAAGKPILCEKPLVTNTADADQVLRAVKGKARFMTAFPCRFAPSYIRLKERVKAGDIGAIQAICATNRGRCPLDWFVEVDQSGGGAMIDHTVHVADLLRDLLGQDPSHVQAQTGNNMYGQQWEDTAMVTVEYPGGVFATIDSSWSRTKNYKTWGDVTMNVVGSKGLIELNMFGLSADVWSDSHVTNGYGSNIDDALVNEWISSIQEDHEPVVTLEDGLAASRLAIAAYESARKREAVSVA
jgi:predicted dehydrogenase